MSNHPPRRICCPENTDKWSLPRVPPELAEAASKAIAMMPAVLSQPAWGENGSIQLWYSTLGPLRRDQRGAPSLGFG